MEEHISRKKMKTECRSDNLTRSGGERVGRTTGILSFPSLKSNSSISSRDVGRFGDSISSMDVGRFGDSMETGFETKSTSRR